MGEFYSKPTTQVSQNTRSRENSASNTICTTSDQSAAVLENLSRLQSANYLSSNAAQLGSYSALNSESNYTNSTFLPNGRPEISNNNLFHTCKYTILF